MFRFAALLLLLLFTVLAGCGPEEPITGLDDSPALGSGPEEFPPVSSLEPPVDPEIAEFVRRAEFLARRFIAVAPTVERLELALDSGEDAVFRLLEIDPEEGRRAYRQLQRDALRLSERHPRVRSMVEEFERSGSPPCETWELTDLVRRIHEDPASMRMLGQKYRWVVCEVIPYSAALVLCTVSGNPIMYAACSVFAMCNFCSGDFVDRVCGG